MKDVLMFTLDIEVIEGGCSEDVVWVEVMGAY